MLEDAIVRFLLEKVQHPVIQVQVKAVKVSITTGISDLYTTTANHISTVVSQLLEYFTQNRVISVVEVRGTSDGIHNPHGSIISENLIPNWSNLGIKDNKKIMAIRETLGIRLRKCGRGDKGGNPGENNNKS